MIAVAMILLAGAAEPAVVLRGRIEAATPGEPVVGAADEVVIGTPTRIRLRIRKVEAGSWSGGRTLETVVPMASLPQSERSRSVLLIVERDAAGWKSLAWDTVTSGLCVSDEFPAAHGLADDWPRLKKRGIVSCD